MSLANDILRRAAVMAGKTPPPPDPPPKPPAHPQDTISPRLIHRASVPGIERKGAGWMVRGVHKRHTFHVGAYQNIRQAWLALQLWRYWIGQGFTGYDIPRAPSPCHYRHDRVS